MPLRANHLIGEGLGVLLYITNSKSKQITEKNIAMCFPKLNPKEQLNLVKKSLIEDGKIFTELGYIWCKTPEKNLEKVVSIEGQKLISKTRETIFVIPHQGCWELAVRMSGIKQSDKTTVLYKPLDNPKYEKVVLAYREGGGLELAQTNKAGVMKLQRALKKKRKIGILPDQDPGEFGYAMSDFFGVKTRTMTLLSRLSIKSDADLIMVVANRLDKGGGYSVVFSKIETNGLEDTIEERVDIINKNIENLVKKKPEQYLWNYRRFKDEIKY
jgi:KDO2-lipid IV(A) lauroyltransferase